MHSIPSAVTIFILFVPLIAANQIITTSGIVEGITVSNEDLRIEAFLGVPYAEPPIGNLRFQRPLAKKPWSGVYKAEKLPPSCMQSNSGDYFEPSMDTPMSEDCLFLNLWVPHSKAEGNLKAIMVFIHGGAFQIGSSNMKLYDGANLAKKDVIVASINYRLGSFGFIFIDNSEASGNVGFIDQIMALKWIKANAKAFGGDPDNIVLFGESAGSISIGCHMLSPLSKNLFRRVIMQSGAPEHPHVQSNNSRVLTISKMVAQKSGCAGKTSGDVVSCLKGLPAKVISDAEGEASKNVPLGFVPSIGDDFLPNTPPHRLTHGNFDDVEVLTGIVEAEGPFFLATAAPDYFKDGQIPISTKRMARTLLRMVLRTAGSIKEDKEVADYYINSIVNGTSNSFLDAIGNTLGDYYIACSTYFHAEFVSLKNPVYYYVLKRRPSSTPLGEWTKTTHFDELQYVFGNPLFKDFTPEEKAFSEKVMRRWVAFAKTGNPNIPGELEWPRFQRDDHKYLVISEDDSIHSENPSGGRCEYWRKKFETVINEEVLARFNP